MERESESWHIALFNKSLLKQAKLKHLLEASGLDRGSAEGLRCLDLGSDNGVISYFLRKCGGSWASGDLTKQSVDSITSLVKDDVHLLDPTSLPFANEEFDLVIVVDMLEHVEDDGQLLKEISRTLKPGGRVVLNIPNEKAGSPLKWLRNQIGQTDEAHGHLTSGYSASYIASKLQGVFSIEKEKTYSRFFTELIDTLIVFAYSFVSGKGHGAEEGEVSKGLVVTEGELKKFEKKFKLYTAIYPIVWTFSRLDFLIPFVPGFMRIVTARKN